jgi:hypothetical protein
MRTILITSHLHKGGPTVSSSWDTSTGLLDSFTLEVSEAWFGKNDKFPNNLVFNLRGNALVEGEIVDPEHTELFTCGEAWKDGQGGAIAVSTSGAEMFNANSKIGRLIDSIKALGSDAAFMAGRGESFEAASWIGVSMDLERNKIGSFETDEGETKEITAMLATGIREISEAATTAATPATETAAASNAGGSSKVLKALLTALAKKTDDNDGFVAAALDPAQFNKAGELESDEELLDAVLDGSFYAGVN